MDNQRTVEKRDILREIKNMGQENTGYLPWETASAFFNDAYMALGVPQEDAAVCVKIMLESDMRGIKSHGCNRFRPIYMARIETGAMMAKTDIRFIRETPSCAVLDGNNGMGMVISAKAMDLAIEKAKKCGIAMVVVRNSTHYGIAGYYSSMAAERGLIGISGTNTRPSVAPTGGVENLLGTNPISVAFPIGKEYPFCFDCATSMIPRGKVEYYARNELPLPEGAVLDSDGNCIQDARIAKEAFDKNAAALTPLGGRGTETGGHKGYGLSVVVEVLSAALQNGPYLRLLNGLNEDGTFARNSFGHFFMVIDPEAFLGRDVFEQIAGNIMQELKDSARSDPETAILVAGEKEYLNKKQALSLGLPLNQSLEQDFIAVRDKLMLPYVFSFEK